MTDIWFSLSEIMSFFFWTFLHLLYVWLEREHRLPADTEAALAWRNDGRAVPKQKRGAGYGSESLLQ